jgi:hypothetical protein
MGPLARPRRGSGIQPGTPVAEHRRVGYTAEDRTFRLMISVIPGDTIVLRYVVAT